jgi:hypothetical protein
MKVYAVYKNDTILNGKLFGLPEQAYDYFAEEFLKVYPNAKLENYAQELKKDLVESGSFSVQIESDGDEWGCKTYVDSAND